MNNNGKDSAKFIEKKSAPIDKQIFSKMKFYNRNFL